MNKIVTFFALSFFTFPFTFCSGHSANNNITKTHDTVSNSSDRRGIDTTYMRTGFYFLANNESDGVTMKEEGSDNIYLISKVPFASVDHIKQTRLKTTKLEKGDYTELCMIFDTIGTQDLANGTGNISFPKIAVVLAGKLLYVVDNTSKIKTGIMCVGLQGYSRQELEAI